MTLALGIGVNTAVFTIVDAVLLRLLPFRDPGRLVVLWQTQPDHGQASVLRAHLAKESASVSSQSSTRTACSRGDSRLGASASSVP